MTFGCRDPAFCSANGTTLGFWTRKGVFLVTLFFSEAMVYVGGGRRCGASITHLSNMFFPPGGWRIFGSGCLICVLHTTLAVLFLDNAFDM